MPRFNNSEDILNYAIAEEEQAAAFYQRLADMTDRSWMKGVFLDFAREEQAHRDRLLAVKENNKPLVVAEKIRDLKIAEYLVEVDAAEDMTYQEALIIAMKKEKAAFKMYTELAEHCDEPHLKQLLLALAQEEARHKLRFEVEYDDLLE